MQLRTAFVTKLESMVNVIRMIKNYFWHQLEILADNNDIKMEGFWIEKDVPFITQLKKHTVVKTYSESSVKY